MQRHFTPHSRSGIPSVSLTLNQASQDVGRANLQESHEALGKPSKGAGLLRCCLCAGNAVGTSRPYGWSTKRTCRHFCFSTATDVNAEKTPTGTEAPSKTLAARGPDFALVIGPPTRWRRPYKTVRLDGGVGCASSSYCYSGPGTICALSNTHLATLELAWPLPRRSHLPVATHTHTHPRIHAHIYTL